MSHPIQPFHYRHEVYRKLIHLSSLWMPVAIYFLEKKTSLIVFAAGAAFVLAYEVIRRQEHGAAKLLDRIFGAALRPDEKGEKFKPSGAVYVLTAAFFCTLFFPKVIALTALAMMLTGDAAAALVGRKFGRNMISNKSIEGATAFFVIALTTAAVISICIPVDAKYIAAVTAAAFVAAIVELLSQKIRIDDNLSVPLAAGVTMMLVQGLF